MPFDRTIARVLPFMTEVFVIYLSHSGQMLGKCLNQATTAFLLWFPFNHLPINLLFNAVKYEMVQRRKTKKLYLSLLSKARYF
jgi:hypothetical protein